MSVSYHITTRCQNKCFGGPCCLHLYRVVTPCGVAVWCHRFGRSSYLHRRHNPEDVDLNLHRHESFKSRSFVIVMNHRHIPLELINSNDWILILHFLTLVDKGRSSHNFEHWPWPIIVFRQGKRYHWREPIDDVCIAFRWLREGSWVVFRAAELLRVFTGHEGIANMYWSTEIVPVLN